MICEADLFSWTMTTMCAIPPPACPPGAGCGAGCAKYGDGGAVAADVSWPGGVGGDSVDGGPADGDCEGGPAWKGCTDVHPASSIASAHPPARESRPIRVIGPC